MLIKKIMLFFILPLSLEARSPGQEDLSRWEREARAATIVRDNWGIPHVFGKTDADCVFGLMYAQCEDDFSRIEMNYVEKLGRMAEIKGEPEIYNDLLNRLVIDSLDAMRDYKKSPPWLKKLLDAFTDGINYFLYKNPGVKPQLLRHFEPWYPLLWTDGSIGSINTAGISVRELKNFYAGSAEPLIFDAKEDAEPVGSNGFAISPSRTVSGNALLYINPHVSFYFRPEVQMTSEEGLNSYGAVTWGQFFVYQGFNAHCGWMHTSSEVDVADLYIEKIVKKGASLYYVYDHAEKPVRTKKIRIRYRIGEETKVKNFFTLFTHHGPIMAKRNGEWLSMKANNRSMDGLIQSWLRTKAKSFAEFKKVLNIRSNTSNNTVYADAEGNIAYWHGNFVPLRNKNFDWARPVDGSVRNTEWQGIHSVNELVHLYNPPNGWIQNCNSTPYTVAGMNSPDKKKYPAYMAPDGENYRGINAVRVLEKENKFTLEKLIGAGYDNYLAAFETLIPALVAAFEKNTKPGDSLYEELAGPVAALKVWDLRSTRESVATTLAIEWGTRLLSEMPKYSEGSDPNDQVLTTNLFAERASAADLLGPLQEAVRELKKSFGKWQIPLEEINRYQRINGDIDLPFSDHAPSLGVGFVSSTWGCLPSFASRYFPGTKLRYGFNGNSFICAVEFGKRIRAMSLLTGGESGHPDSKHFSDQAEMYVEGKFKDVLFYREDILAHAEKTYHPGK